jgi:TniQ
MDTLIQSLSLLDPAWPTTFPHRVMPLQDEWLPGLLLRCDEVNHWECRTTLTHVLSPGPEKFHRYWRTETPYLIVIRSSALNLDALAQLLALPMNVLITTTYHMELARLYSPREARPQFLNETFLFHLCPACIAEARLLRRTLTLPHITICPQHRLLLTGQCLCGTSLHLFHRQSPPFTCYACGQDWAKLPWIEAISEHVEQEQKFLTWYAFFFSKGTPLILRAAQYMMIGFSRELLPLGRLLPLLVQSGRFPQDVLNWMNQASPLQKKGMNANAYRHSNASQQE